MSGFLLFGFGLLYGWLGFLVPFWLDGLSDRPVSRFLGSSVFMTGLTVLIWPLMMALVILRCVFSAIHFGYSRG